MPGPSDAERPRPRRVLIIDDHLDTAESMAACLRVAGYRVEVAHEGIAGLEVARRFLPDVILCDIFLPGVDGYYVARALRADPLLAKCYFVAVSGRELHPKDRSSGFHEYLLKPVDSKALLAAVGRAPLND